MITFIEIEGFKCFFTKTVIAMSQITVCAGMNSVGKSTLVQSLLLMKQSYKSKNKDILLNTDSLNLGSSRQIMSGKMRLATNNSFFEYVSEKDDLLLRKINEKKGESSLSGTLYYLNAERIGPRNYHAMQNAKVSHCGYKGEHTFDVINRNKNALISAKRCYNNKTAQMKELAFQINRWMEYIANDVSVDFSSDEHTLLANMKVRQPDMDTPFSSPHNFGFGISYVLPIITTGLIAKENTIFIVENPEAHLHPAGQSRIGEFLAQVSCDNVQVVVETHSEHVINGIRKYALKNKLTPDKICLNYFAIDGEPKKHSVTRILLNENMDILSWPPGFFDQELNDMKEIRELRKRL